MGKYLLTRLWTGFFVLFAVITFTFFLSRVIPSDPAQRWVGAHATEEQKAAAVIELGLDKPLHVQYLGFMRKLLKGNMGISIVSHRPVLDELKEAIPNTLEIVFLSVLLAFFLGLPIGVYSAIHDNTFFDHIMRFVSVGVISVPTFWFAMMLQILIANYLGWLPLSGQLDTVIKLTSPITRITGFAMVDSLVTGNWTAFWNVLKHSILPVITLASYSFGLTVRMTRSILLEVLEEDFIKASRAWGIRERLVIWRFAIKNVIGAVVTVLALSAGNALVSTFVIEAIFSWPGIGNYIALSVMNLDYPAIVGVTIFASFSYVVLNFFADVVVAMDPRIRFAEGGRE
ncbi:MAG: ABC transporter permease [Thermovirgaceae bacterium]|jgi:peptide/nickel transport system permease protein|nr:ABC transporter permease [Synergistales bacterium]MDD5515449.1 ABC transporter permease [Synergistales bacterium]MDI9392258.1 ABC transporter permease [Synergistota bacterium]HOI81175.1 ABC transporter permease [Synergistales bacterium]